MQSLTRQRYLIVSVLILAVALLGISAAVHAQGVPTLQDGQAGTTLTVTKTAAGFYERRITYIWTIDKSVTPTTLEIGRNATQQFTYEIHTSRTPSLPTDTFGVRGEICVTNGGAVATEQLTIVDVVQSKPMGPGQFEDVIPQPVTLGAFPQLAPGQRHCYPYEVTAPGPIPPDTSYRNEARVAITNHSGALDEIHVTVSRADFSLPTDPTITETDEFATVTDVEQCPAGFTCVPSKPGPFTFPNTAGLFTVSFTKAVTNVGAACNSTFAITNTVTLETNDTNTSSPDYTLAGITTPVCPPITVGCTHTLGFWLTHPTAWPVFTLTLGTAPPYGQAQLLSILSEPPRGNGLVQLARQLIAAKLNVATGATTPAGVANNITGADLLIGARVVPPVGTGYLPSGQTSGLVANLDEYNNGLAEGGAPHCGE